MKTFQFLALLCLGSLSLVDAKDKLKCLKVTTGEHHNHDGTIYVFVNGNKVASSNKVYGKGEVVINKCYKSLDKVQVQNPTKNGWAGSISASSKADGKFIPLTGCSNCKAGSDKAKEAFVVDGDDVGATLGKIACMKGAMCTLRFTPDGVNFSGVCEASTWNAGDGVFSDAKNWRSQKAPTKSNVVVVSGDENTQVEVKEETSVGYLVLEVDLVLEEDVAVTGDLDCSDGECGSTTFKNPATKQSKQKPRLYDFAKDKICPVNNNEAAMCAGSFFTPPSDVDVADFSDAQNWLYKKAPKENDVIYVNSMDAKVADIGVIEKKATAGDVWLIKGSNIILEKKNLDVVGDLDCRNGCPTTEPEATYFVTKDEPRSAICPAKPKTTTTTTTKPKTTTTTKPKTTKPKTTKPKTKPTKPKTTKPTKIPLDSQCNKQNTKSYKFATKDLKNGASIEDAQLFLTPPKTCSKSTTKPGVGTIIVDTVVGKQYVLKFAAKASKPIGDVKVGGRLLQDKKGGKDGGDKGGKDGGDKDGEDKGGKDGGDQGDKDGGDKGGKDGGDKGGKDGGDKGGKDGGEKGGKFSVGFVSVDDNELEFKAEIGSNYKNVKLHFTATKKKTALAFTEKAQSCILINQKGIELSDCKPTSGGCKKNCQGHTCDYWADEEDYTCTVLEKDYGCNCAGCKCLVDDKVCAMNKCNGKTCDEWVELGLSCAALKEKFKCKCTSCQCKEPRKTTTTSTTSTTTTSAARDTTTTSTSTSTSTTTLSGCTNKKACNYNKNAKGDDGSCKLPKACHDCKDKCICKEDACGVCGGKGPGSDMKACGAKKGVQVNWIKDKTCDDAHNNCICGWDGGDCCMDKKKNPDTFKYCSKCGCLDPTFVKKVKKGDCGICEGECGKPKYKSDKYCDDENNNCACNWDGGDCCGQGNNYKYCKDCACKDCKFEHKGDKCIKSMKGTCGQEKWKGDKNCDDENNNAGCNWDGGDCCGANSYAYCKECKCLDCTFVSKGDECVKAIKSACGAANYVGDKYCDDNNNNAGCNWDKGDCCGPANNYKFCKKCECKDCTYESKGDDCVKSIKKGCGSPNWKGDGNCDDNNNNAGCSWDGGDCCGPKNYQYCKECKCKDCTYVKKGDKCVDDFKKSCGAPKFKGDGFCDDTNNYGGCAWDGGDCCGDKANIKYCKLCECRDCTKAKQKDCPGKKSCKFPNYKKDGNCDDENNNCRCDWDGGDCCAKSNKGSVNTKYCKACACLDPENKGDSNCKGFCKFPNYKGDGNCDDENNNCGCQYDGGDCCAKTVDGGKVKKPYCKECKCLDPKASSSCSGTCKFKNYKGDGNCDDDNNNCGCEYDGGDCCAKTVKGKEVKTQFCNDCKCLDPNACDGTCKFPNYKGDGNCDDENNNCGCAYDGGDCCAKTVKGGKVKKNFCKACACLDPSGK